MSKRPAANVASLFGQDSDEEEDTHQEKRPRPGAPAEELAAEINGETRAMADKLASYVALNGDKYEQMTRERNSITSPFG